MAFTFVLCLGPFMFNPLNDPQNRLSPNFKGKQLRGPRALTTSESH